ncbi:trypsin-like peptidase domain-containing protein [Anabaena azotica]|uniref:S1 family peptidase n=1 Tax=Anabaena azotica TaxID=197653 RepID=UPI0039A6F755
MNPINFNTHKSAIIRLFYQERVVGIGFLVAEKYAFTCAHVVAQALMISSTTSHPPDGEIEIDFPLANSKEKIKAKVVYWCPESGLNSSETIEDIAVLKLENILASAYPTRLILSENISKNPFKVFGCPAGVPFGVWATGVISEQIGKQWIQLEDNKVTGYAIEAGFSGSPVWDEQLQGVVGMVVAADRKRDTAKVAFMIPTQILISPDICQVIGELTATFPQLNSTNISATAKVQEPIRLTDGERRRLERECKELQDQYDSLSEEIQFLQQSERIDDLSPKERFRLKKQIEEIISEREKISDKITILENKLQSN